jgi:hypothetical protein
VRTRFRFSIPLFDSDFKYRRVSFACCLWLLLFWLKVCPCSLGTLTNQFNLQNFRIRTSEKVQDHYQANAQGP